MLTNVHVEHYKAFDGADVPLKPITVLLGANSVGKSSIIQLLLMLQQTAQEDNMSYKSALKMYGGYINLGSTENIFHKTDVTKPVTVSLSVNNKNLHALLSEAFGDFLEDLKDCARMFPIKGLLELREREIKTKKDYLNFISDYKNAITKDKVKIYKDRLKYFRITGIGTTIGDVLEASAEMMEKVYDYLHALFILSADEFSFRFKIKYVDKTKLEVESFGFYGGEKCIFSYDSSNESYDVYSDFVTYTLVEKNLIKKSFEPDKTVFTCISKVYGYRSDEDRTSNLLVSYTLNVLSRALDTLIDEFQRARINYVSPLRAHPKRYYMLDKAKVAYSLDTLDGDAIAEVLKENASLKRRVNMWLKNFGLAVNVEEFKEVIHHLKVSQNGLNLDITDVGFGISQVLPIIIQGFLSGDRSLTIIEQPEIHLHPKMQADLADLFIDMTRVNRDKEILIETHSEYLLRRLRRRISEGKIRAEDVSICLFHPQTLTQGAIIESLNIEDTGMFNWPEEFYDGELSKDITEFIKNQVRKDDIHNISRFDEKS